MNKKSQLKMQLSTACLCLLAGGFCQSTWAAEADRLSFMDEANSKVLVKSFSFSGATLLNEGELQSLVQPMLGQTLSMAEVIKGAQRITARYAALGFVAHAFVPAQTMADGRISIMVLESRLGAVDAVKEDGLSFSDEQARSFVLATQPLNKPIQLAKLERAILLLSDLDGLDASSTLKRGKDQGSTNLQLTLKKTPPWSGNVMLDNGGSRSVGEYRLSAAANWDNPSGHGDQLAGRLISMLGSGTPSLYARLTYTTPIGSDGFKLGVSLANLGYSLGGDYKQLDAEGHSRVWGLSGIHPCIRSPEFNLYGVVEVERKELESEAAAQTISDKRINSMQLGFNLSSQPKDGRSYSSLLVRLVNGRVSLKPINGLPTTDPLGIGGGYRKLVLVANRLQAINERWSIWAQANGQLASRNLDSAEELALGGPTGVRAYPVSEGSGDEALIINLEARYRLNEQWLVYGFLDSGHTKINEQPFAGQTTANSYSLSAMGFGVQTGKANQWEVKASIAWRLGDNPGRLANGKDADGGKRNPRLWFSAVHYF